MNNLSNEIVRLSKILEKQIPKGYHEIVVEYVRQDIASAVCDLIVMILCILVIYLITKVIIKSCKNKEDSIFFEENIYCNSELNVLGFATIMVVILIGAFILFAFAEAFFDIQISIQHAVAPNYYLIKSFIK